MRNISIMNEAYNKPFGNANPLIGRAQAKVYTYIMEDGGVLYSKATRLQDWLGVEQMTELSEKRGIPWKSYCSIRSNVKARFEMPDKKYPIRSKMASQLTLDPYVL